MKVVISIILLLSIFLNRTFAQEDKIFNRNHFTLNLQHGLTRGKAIQEYGTIKPQGNIGHTFHANLNYTVNINQNFGLSIGSGLGAFPINFKFGQIGEYFIYRACG